MLISQIDPFCNGYANWNISTKIYSYDLAIKNK